MPGKKHKIKGTIVYTYRKGKVDRYRYGKKLWKDGKLYQQRFGWQGENKLIELALVPI